MKLSKISDKKLKDVVASQEKFQNIQRLKEVVAAVEAEQVEFTFSDVCRRAGLDKNIIHSDRYYRCIKDVINAKAQRSVEYSPIVKRCRKAMDELEAENGPFSCWMVLRRANVTPHTLYMNKYKKLQLEIKYRVLRSYRKVLGLSK